MIQHCCAWIPAFHFHVKMSQQICSSNQITSSRAQVCLQSWRLKSNCLDVNWSFTDWIFQPEKENAWLFQKICTIDRSTCRCGINIGFITLKVSVVKNVGILIWHLQFIITKNSRIATLLTSDTLKFVGKSISVLKIQFHKEVQPLIFSLKWVKVQKCRLNAFVSMSNWKNLTKWNYLLSNRVQLSRIFSHALWI